ncbi:RNA helicase [Mycena kentingensis (nom. inval.)]|nr:RNA helicase [Mycena kentingensis (nom. inval.)]
MSATHASEATPLLSTGGQEVSRKSIVSEIGILTKYATRLPACGSQLLEHSIVMAPILSIGHMSTTALAGITLGSMTMNVTGITVLQGLGGALDTLLPPAWTSPHPELVGLWSQRMAVVMAAVLLPMYFLWWNAEVILLALKQDPEVVYFASLYLRWVSMGMPGYALNLITRRYFQSQGLFAIPTQILCIVALVNAVLNYLLVWGPRQIRLGFIGAPIATCLSLTLAAILSLAYGAFLAPRPRTAWTPLSAQSFTNLGMLIRLGAAGVGQIASEWWAWEFAALAASWLGPESLASQSILLSSATTTWQAFAALGLAAAVRVGNLLGERNPSRARVAANIALAMVLFVSLLLSIMLLVLRNSWAYMFSSDPAVVQCVASILPIIAVFQVFDGVSSVIGGQFRAKGQQVRLHFSR